MSSACLIQQAAGVGSPNRFAVVPFIPPAVADRQVQPALSALFMPDVPQAPAAAAVVQPNIAAVVQLTAIDMS